MQRSTSLLAQALLAASILSPAALAQGGPPPTPVRVDPAVQQEVQNMRRVSGEIRAKRRSMIAVRESGLVTELAVREGQRVEAGQVLAQLDASRLEDDLAVFDAQLRQARAGAAEQDALLAQAERDLATLEELSRRDAVNPKELADAKSDVAVGRARLASSQRAIGVVEAQTERLRQRITDMRPTAPFAGVVLSRNTEVGQWLGAGATIVEIVADRELEALIDVPQSYYGPLTSLTGAVELDISAAGRRSSTSWRVVPLVASAGRTFPLIVDLEDPTGLAPGMSVVAEVPTGERAQQLTVSRDGILRNATGSFVYVARPGAEGAPSTAGMAPIDVLFFVGDRAVVRSPSIRPGDLVIVEGNERLYPTAPVQPMGAGGPADSASETAVAKGGDGTANLPTLTVTISLAGATPATMESEAVAPIELKLRSLGFVDGVKSLSEKGTGTVVATLGPRTTNDAIEALAAAVAKANLPEGARVAMTSTDDDFDAVLTRIAGRSKSQPATGDDQ